jgi:hypothetical protein
MPGPPCDGIFDEFVDPKYAGRVRNAFQGEPVAIKLEKDLTIFRHWGNGVDETGSRWFTNKIYKDPGRARKFLALPDSNSAEYVSKFTIPSGAIILVGKASDQIDNPLFHNKAYGGGMKIYIPNITAPIYGGRIR